MNSYNKTIFAMLKIFAFSALAVATVNAEAAVKFRVGYEADTGRYAVYMTPDATPSPDLLLSAQTTLVVPHGANARYFNVSDIQSSINGLRWELQSRIDTPAENPVADYLSFNYVFMGSTPPRFGWIAGQEKKIFSFSNSSGCRAGVKLMDNKDVFNQLPNSVNTNPGNDFMNLGWSMTNAYTGNYGGSVRCGVVANACQYTGQDKPILKAIAALAAQKGGASAALLKQINRRIALLKTRLSCTK